MFRKVWKHINVFVGNHLKFFKFVLVTYLEWVDSRYHLVDHQPLKKKISFANNLPDSKNQQLDYGRFP